MNTLKPRKASLLRRTALEKTWAAYRKQKWAGSFTGSLRRPVESAVAAIHRSVRPKRGEILQNALTMGIPIVEGRSLQEHDSQTDPPAAVAFGLGGRHRGATRRTCGLFVGFRLCAHGYGWYSLLCITERPGTHVAGTGPQLSRGRFPVLLRRAAYNPALRGLLTTGWAEFPGPWIIS